MRESQIENKCCNWAIAQGWLSFKFTSPANRGVPDRMFIRDGAVIFVEFKAPGEELRPLQQRVITKIREHGAKVYVCDSVEGFINVMS